MATITGKTEFARRVAAMGLSLVDFHTETRGLYSLSTIQQVSRGDKMLSPRLLYLLEQVEAQHQKKNRRKKKG